MKQRFTSVFITLVSVLLMTGCTTHIDLTITENDTYTMAVDISIPKSEKPDYSCREFKKDLGTPADSDQVSIVDQSTPSTTVCHMEFTQSQPIAATKHPFVEITRKGDIYRAHLAPIDDLAMLANYDIDFRLSLTFPGNVIDASGRDNATINGKTVTWSDKEILYRGFSAEGYAYAGMPVWKRSLLLLAAVIVVTIAIFIIFRHTATIQQIVAWLKQLDKRLGSPTDKFVRLLEKAYFAIADRLYLLFHKP